MRYSIIKVFMRTRSELLPFVTHTAITLILLTGVTAMVILLLGLGLASGVAFSLILNLTGGIGGTLLVLATTNTTCLSFTHTLYSESCSMVGSIVTLILPAAIYLKIMPKESDLTNYAWALFVFGFIVMIAVVVVTILTLASA